MLCTVILPRLLSFGSRHRAARRRKTRKKNAETAASLASTETKAEAADRDPDARMVTKHYGHLAPSHVADAIRAALPKFGPTGQQNVTDLRAHKP